MSAVTPILNALVGRWVQWTSIGYSAPDASLRQREFARRSRLISWLALGLLGGIALLSPLAIEDLRARVTLLIWLVGVGVALLLNRRGSTSWAAVILILLLSGGLLEANLASPIGLTMGELPNFDAYAVAVVIAATVLPRWSTFLVAMGNSGLIVANYLLEPHYQDLQQNAALYTSVQLQTVSLIARPIALQFVMAVVAFLWMRSMDRALIRADRAEEVAELRSRELARARVLEDDVRVLLQTHTDVANGNFSASVPPLHDPSLWQVGVSLNLLIRRFQNLIAQYPQMERAQATERRLWMMTQEADGIARALDQLRRGEKPKWPEPSGTPLDTALFLLRDPETRVRLEADTTETSTNPERFWPQNPR